MISIFLQIDPQYILLISELELEEVVEDIRLKCARFQRILTSQIIRISVLLLFCFSGHQFF